MLCYANPQSGAEQNGHRVVVSGGVWVFASDWVLVWNVRFRIWLARGEGRLAIRGITEWNVLSGYGSTGVRE